MSDQMSKMILLDTEGWADSPQITIHEFSAVNQGDIEIDASKADEISAQVAQLLIAGDLSAQSRSARLCLINPTEGVQKSLELLGLSDHFQESRT